MKITFFSSKSYDKEFFNRVNGEMGTNYEIKYIKQRLDIESVALVKDSEVCCIFVNDDASRPVLIELKNRGVKAIALRCAGFNNVDLDAAKELGLHVCRVPAYSPEAVAEFAAALLLTVNRKVHRAYNRTREGNFSLENLMGFNLYQKTAGVIGTGKIGIAMIRILRGFGMRVLCYDVYENPEVVALGCEYTDLDTIYAESEVISLHCPLLPSTYYLLNEESFDKMKDGVIIINSSRGGLIDTQAAIKALRSGKVSGLGLDVYENEQALFFEDKSNICLDDDLYLRLTSLPNVVLTGHQGFFTYEALTAIAEVTLGNVKSIEADETTANFVV